MCVYFQVPYHELLVSAWFSLISSDYHASTFISSEDNIKEPAAKTTAMYVKQFSLRHVRMYMGVLPHNYTCTYGPGM